MVLFTLRLFRYFVPKFKIDKMKYQILVAAALLGTAFVGCKKKGCTDKKATNYSSKAKKDDGSCKYASNPSTSSYNVPSTYVFKDANGNSTVSFGGQTSRLNQLSEMVTKMKSGTSSTVSAQDLKDMFANVGNNGNGNFSFSAPGKQLKNKCFPADVSMFEGWMDDLATASASNATTAVSGTAGTLTSGSKTYLLDANGREKVQFIEKGLMGAVFMNQALNSYFGETKMNVDNTGAVDAAGGKHYTKMEHHWDEAFGYFGVAIDFPTTQATRFWGKYCNKQNGVLNSNADMMDNFLKGRAAISANVMADRNAAIEAIRKEWEEISAYQAMKYIDGAIANFGTDQAKFLHELSEAYAFAWNLRYASEATRRMSPLQHTAMMNLFKANFWDMTVADLNAIKGAIDAKF